MDIVLQILSGVLILFVGFAIGFTVAIHKIGPTIDWLAKELVSREKSE